jgi:hypothetical protein
MASITQIKRILLLLSLFWTSVLAADDISIFQRLTIPQEEFDRCVQLLEEASNEGLLSRQEYIIFLEDYSSRTLFFENFDDLPLPLVLLFYAAACSSGRDCVNVEPTISLDNGGFSQAMLGVFCSSISDMHAVQVIFRFQYMLRYPNELSVEDILQGGSNTIKQDLEEASELVLLDRFGCEAETSQRRTREFLLASVFQGQDESFLIEEASLSPHTKLQYNMQGTIDDAGRQLQPSFYAELPDCDFRVDAGIRNIFEIGK